MFRDTEQLRPDGPHGHVRRVPRITRGRRKPILPDQDTGENEPETNGQDGKKGPASDGWGQFLTGLLGQEDGKNNQHDNAAHIHDDLHRRDEFHAQPEIQPGDAGQGEQKPDGGSEYSTGGDRQQSRDQDKRRNKIENERNPAHYSTPSLILEPGLFNFFVSWLRS